MQRQEHTVLFVVTQDYLGCTNV